MAKRPKNVSEDEVPATASLIAAAAKRLRKRKDKKYQESLDEMGMMEDGGGRANVSRKKRDTNYMDAPKPRKKAMGGKMSQTADGCAKRGKTRLAMKGYGKVG